MYVYIFENARLVLEDLKFSTVTVILHVDCAHSLDADFSEFVPAALVADSSCL